MANNTLNVNTQHPAPHAAPMHRALALAHQALWLTSPNPRVGCVITAPDGTVLGEGHTQRAGGPHAEIMALRLAAERGQDVRGATAWVTLEPCAHQGRTGPCCDALAAAGIGRVVAALTDPNPRVAGQGLARLQAAGVQVETLPASDPLALQARELNIGFFSRMERGLPWVRMKIAASIDGQTALQNGHSQWITGAPARLDGHAWRARACAVLTGIGTVLEDDPQLNVRGLDVPRQPHLAVVDSRLDLPLNAKLLDTLGSGEQARQIWVYTATHEQQDKRAALMARGVFTQVEDRKLLPFALGSACATATYTLIDGLGARVSGDAPGYVAWVFIADGLIFTTVMLLWKGLDVLPRDGKSWGMATFASAASYGSYAVAIWAMTFAPLAVVAALRETSILFAVLIGWLVFGERMTKGKALAALVIVGGVMLTRL